MNQQIRQLALQAGDSIPEFHFGDYNIPNEFIEKFAELIVMECGILADQYQFEKKNPNPLATERLPLLSSDFIYEHFGVE